jgi:hypothetical protein
MVAKAASNPQMLNDLEAASSRQQQPITGNDLQELTNMNTSDLAAVVEGFFPNIELNSGNLISFTSGCSTCILKRFSCVVHVFENPSLKLYLQACSNVKLCLSKGMQIIH